MILKAGRDVGHGSTLATAEGAELQPGEGLFLRASDALLSVLSASSGRPESEGRHGGPEAQRFMSVDAVGSASRQYLCMRFSSACQLGLREIHA